MSVGDAPRNIRDSILGTIGRREESRMPWEKIVAIASE